LRAVLPSLLLVGTRDVPGRMTRMGVARIVVGLSVAQPDLGARIFGAPPEDVNATARLLARLFAIRNITLGAWALTMRNAKGSDLRRCVTLNLAVDSADLVAIAPAIARRGLRRAAAMSALLAANATLGWLQILNEL
jgi:hypothetical protein